MSVGGSSGITGQGQGSDVLDIATGGLSGAVQGLTPNISAPPMTAEQKATMAALSGQGQQLGDLGSSMLTDFQAGTLTTGQNAEVAASQQAATASSNDFLAKSGLADSSIATGMSQQIDQQSAILTQQLLQGNFSEAMQAMGGSAQDYSSVMSGGQFQQNLQQNAQNANLQAQTQMYSSIFGVAGEVAGAAMLA